MTNHEFLEESSTFLHGEVVTWEPPTQRDLLVSQVERLWYFRVDLERCEDKKSWLKAHLRRNQIFFTIIIAANLPTILNKVLDFSFGIAFILMLLPLIYAIEGSRRLRKIRREISDQEAILVPKRELVAHIELAEQDLEFTLAHLHHPDPEHD